jgi:hypothetical protein
MGKADALPASDTADSPNRPPERARGAQTPAPVTFDLVTHLHRQREFSLRTFGPGTRTNGVVDHIRKELYEIHRQPHDLSEWVDVVLLALDGAWRSGHEPEAIAKAIAAKQAKNERRTWPDWRTSSPDKAIEHVRSGEAPSVSNTPPEDPKPSGSSSPSTDAHSAVGKSEPAKCDHEFVGPPTCVKCGWDSSESARLLDLLGKAIARAEAAEVERDALRTRAVMAEQHKALSLMGRSSYAEVVEDKLRTQLAEEQIAREAAEAEIRSLRSSLLTLVEHWRGPDAADAIQRGYVETWVALQSCANALDALLVSHSETANTVLPEREGQ